MKRKLTKNRSRSSLPDQLLRDVSAQNRKWRARLTKELRQLQRRMLERHEQIDRRLTLLETRVRANDEVTNRRERTGRARALQPRPAIRDLKAVRLSRALSKLKELMLKLERTTARRLGGPKPAIDQRLRRLARLVDRQIAKRKEAAASRRGRTSSGRLG